MESLAAFGLAANALQFVTLATSLVKEANQIRDTSQSLGPQNAHIADVTGRLRALASAIQATSGGLIKHDGFEHGHSLHAICQGCVELADELTQRLDKLSNGGTSISRFKSYRLALEALWDKSTIDSLFQRLTLFKGEIDTFLLAAISQQMESSSSSHSESLDILMNMGTLSLQEQQDTRAASERRDMDMSAMIRHEHAETRRQITSALLAMARTGLEKQYPNGFAMSYFAATQAAQRLAEKMVIESLTFPALNRRFDSVAEHHRNTCEWIFDDDPNSFHGWDNFTQWLQYSTGVYWVNGKAGSGKSTLLKFLTLDPRLRSRLHTWAGEDVLVVSHHFFWRKGEEPEKSITGLLKTLLSNVFRQAPGLLRSTLPAQLEEAEQGLTEHIYLNQEQPDTDESLPSLLPLRERFDNWRMKDLRTAVERLTSQAAAGYRFFFLIDGLDEFEGDHEETINMLKVLSSSDRVKICVSSRPLPLFERTFGQDRKLKLQDLTANDISIFVNDRLSNSESIRALNRTHPGRVSALKSKIIDKASGVFLWVMLVVKSLLQGLVNGDSIGDLDKRLESLPPDLEDLYWHMVTNIDAIYRPKASMIFQVCQQAESVLTPLFLSYILEDVDDDLAISASRRTVFRLEEEQRMQDIDFRLRSICAGLLEIQSGNRVGFLHRTVGDFFEEPHVHQLLQSFTRVEHFDPNMAILRASLLSLKWKPEVVTRAQPFDHYSEATWADAKMFWALIETGLSAATRADRHGQDLSIELMDAFDTEATFRWTQVRHEGDDANVHWSNFIQFFSRSRASVQEPEIFLHCAIRFQLTSYLRNRLLYHPNRLLNLTGQPLLLAAIPSVIRLEAFQPDPAPQAPSLETIEMLLQAGEDPNATSKARSDDDWAPLKLLLEAGGDPTAALKARYDDWAPTSWTNALHHILSDFHPLNSAYGAKLSDRRRQFGYCWAQVLDLLLRYGANPATELRMVGDAVAIAAAGYHGRDTIGVTIRRSSLAVVRDALRFFDMESAADLEARLVSAGVEYLATTADGRAVACQQRNQVLEPVMAPTKYRLSGLRSIPSAPGVRENLRAAAMQKTGFFLDVIR